MISLKPKRDAASKALPLAAAFVMGIGMALVLMQASQVGATPALVAAGVIGAALGCSALLLAKWRKWAPWALLGIVVVACLVLHSLFIGGFAWLVQGIQHNDFILSGHFRMPLAQADEAGAPLVMALFSGVLSCVSVFANRHGIAAWPVAVVIALLALALSGFASMGVAFAVALLAVALCAAACAQSRLQKWQVSALLKNAVCGLALLLVLTALGAAAATGLNPQRATVHEAVEQAAEQSQLSGRALNHGDLSANHELALSTNSALDVTVDAGEADTLYLRGYTGEVYAEGSWGELDRSVVEDFGERALWLDGEGFSPQGQVAQAASQTKLESGTPTSVQVRNTGAAQALYLPYCYQSSSDLTLSAVPSWQLVEGEADSYSATVLLGATHKAYLIQDSLTKADSGDGYLEQERTYASFAKSAYTQVPADVEETLGKLLGKPGTLSVDQVKYLISAYLDEYYCYDTSPEEAQKGTDPLVWFAASGRSGYSQQYASLAVMMLRHYGIAARYVEGYYVQLPERGEATTVKVTENDAHAWAEYYLDGVGWIPFDVTPGYGNDSNFYDTTDNTTTTDDPQLQGVLDRISKVVSPWKPQVLTQDDSGISDETVPTNRREEPSRAWLAILIAILVLLAALVARILWARKRLARLEAALAAGGNEAVTLGFSYLTYLCKTYFGCTFGNESCQQWATHAAEQGACQQEAFLAAAQANEQALFSARPCQAQQEQAVAQALEQVRSNLRSSRGGLKSMWDRLIMGRY